jgi:hypothetical protein
VMFESERFISTDQGNHYGTVTFDIASFDTSYRIAHNKRSTKGSTSHFAIIFHHKPYSWQRFKYKVLRAANEYNFAYRIRKRGSCKGDGEHVCLEYQHNYLQSNKSLFVWRKKAFLCVSQMSRNSII